MKGTVDEAGETIEAACRGSIDNPDPSGEIWRECIVSLCRTSLEAGNGRGVFRAAGDDCTTARGISIVMVFQWLSCIVDSVAVLCLWLVR